MRKPAPVQYIHIPSHGNRGAIRPEFGRRRRRFGPPRLDPRLVLAIVGVVLLVAAGWWLLRGDTTALPAGAVEEVAVDGAVVTVSGYAYDLDNDADTPVALRLTVDGAVDATEPAITADPSATIDADPAPTRVDAFSFSASLEEGGHDLCVDAIDGDATVSLGCARAFVRAPLLDDAMVIAYYGAPNIPVLGVAGEGTPDEAAAEVQTRAQEWLNQNRRIIPAFDLIASIATRAPGQDGFYSNKLPISEIRPYLDAIRAVDGILIIDLQTGSQDFLTVAKMYEELLLEPDVHLAIDPEWRVPAGTAPGTIIGSVEIEEVNEVGAWLAQLVRDNDLPEKIYMIHQFKVGMIKNRDQLIDHPELAEVIHIDGFGSVSLKTNVYNDLGVDPPLINGLKLFFDEDDELLESADVRNIFFPFPLVITYQ